MAYPIELYCECGVKAKYDFQSQASAIEYRALWDREHAGEGHGPVSKSEFNRIAKQKQAHSA